MQGGAGGGGNVDNGDPGQMFSSTGPGEGGEGGSASVSGVSAAGGGGGYFGGGGGGTDFIGGIGTFTGGGGGGSDFCSGSMTVSGCTVASGAGTGTGAGSSTGDAKVVLAYTVIPILATKASADVVVGSPIQDTATLAGGASPTGSIAFSLYGPDDSSCAGASAFTDTEAVSGNGQYTSASFTPTAPGTYRFTASYSGDQNNSSVSGPCNDSGESVTITATPPVGPSISKLHLVPSSFIAGSKPTGLGPPTPKNGTGTEIRFKLSSDALVHFSIRRVPRRPNPSGPKVPHAFNRRLRAGKESIRFTGTLDHHSLRPGHYKLYARAIDNRTGHRSPKMATAFTVLGR